ncbi:hypothetical protein [Legionella jamestowniensis]|uniref:Uncharacterized protein n=1 Tax=Legionella jamestowniensis TaxID=455 RepID=A0A0W0UG71_9GAMM|nr:hypothetical protein [Legionella jamestowniensis]KTD06847.1 hypothetical protein Ljam_1042 [Legionella jamestowniensis]SFL82328.1 hypothetical protein SAMN02746073_2069 [Legionella jamestowniensis DSM 19215]
MPEKIEDDLKTFADQLLTAISDETQQGQTNLVEIFEQAKKVYTNEDSPFWSWVYSFSRKRGDELNQTIDTLKIFPKPTIRLQEFQKFLKGGEWKTTSANTDLFLLLINSVPGYVKETDSYLYSQIVFPLKRILLNKIKLLLQQYEVSERQAAEREKELQLVRENKSKEIETVHVSNNAEEARFIAINNKDHLAFCLTATDLTATEVNWQLTWPDFNSKVTVLTISENLARVIKNMEVELRNALSKMPSDKNLAEQEKLLSEFLQKSAFARELKTESQKILEELLNKTQVLFCPTEKELENLVSTYVITKEGAAASDSKVTQLYWYNSLGHKNLLNLNDYPELADWIRPKSSLAENEMFRLKVYLREINVRHSIDKTKHHDVQSFLKAEHGVALITTDNWTKIPAYKLIKETYILTREPDAKTGDWVLYQRQRGGVNAQISIDSWGNTNAIADFKEILQKNEGISAANLSAADREKLRKAIKESTIVEEKMAKKDAVVGKLNLSKYDEINSLFAHKASQLPRKPSSTEQENHKTAIISS